MIVFEYKEVKSIEAANEKIKESNFDNSSFTVRPSGTHNFCVYDSDEFIAIWYPNLKVMNLFGKRRINGINFYKKNYPEVMNCADSYQVMKTKRW